LHKKSQAGQSPLWAKAGCRESGGAVRSRNSARRTRCSFASLSQYRKHKDTKALTRLPPDSSRTLLSAGPVSELELDGAHADDVTVGERRLCFDSESSNQSAVCAFEVFHNGAAVSSVDTDARVPAGYVGIIQPDVARGIASDDVVTIRQNKMAIVSDEPPSARLVRGGRRAVDVDRFSAKRVSHSVYRSNEERRLSVVCNCSPDFTNHDVEIGFHNVAVGPDLPQQCFFADDIRPPRQQDAKKIERFRREMNFPAITQQLPRVRIDRELMKPRSHSLIKNYGILINSLGLGNFRCVTLDLQFMRPKVSNSSPERARRPARDVIDAVLDNMQRNLEPLKYSILAPSRYIVYLHPSEYARLEGIIAILQEQTVRALSEEVASRNRPSIVRRYAERFLGGPKPRVENPRGKWSVEFFPDPDGDILEGDILVDSELLLPASPELGIGERTRLVTTVHPRRESPAEERTITRSLPASNALAVARIVYDDNAGHHSYDVKDSVTIGRGGIAYPVDIKISSSADVSREHARIRWEPQTGAFFLIDLSTLGTTLNGRHVPRGYDEVDGRKRENGAETVLPDQSRIGLADTVYMSFSLVRL
jgi:hypothetical protein